MSAIGKMKRSALKCVFSVNNLMQDDIRIFSVKYTEQKKNSKEKFEQHDPSFDEVETDKNAETFSKKSV